DEEDAVTAGLGKRPGERLVGGDEFALERAVGKRADDAEPPLLAVVAGHRDFVADRLLEHPLGGVLLAEDGDRVAGPWLLEKQPRVRLLLGRARLGLVELEPAPVH